MGKALGDIARRVRDELLIYGEIRNVDHDRVSS
jgi:hypothetical protein